MNSVFDKAFALMAWMNDQGHHAARFFDCGELGVIHLYPGRNGWEYRAIEVEPDPTAEEDAVQLWNTRFDSTPDV